MNLEISEHKPRPGCCPACDRPATLTDLGVCEECYPHAKEMEDAYEEYDNGICSCGMRRIDCGYMDDH